MQGLDDFLFVCETFVRLAGTIDVATCFFVRRCLSHVFLSVCLILVGAENRYVLCFVLKVHDKASKMPAWLDKEMLTFGSRMVVADGAVIRVRHGRDY